MLEVGRGDTNPTQYKMGSLEKILELETEWTILDEDKVHQKL
jgi:hypothetical protein